MVEEKAEELDFDEFMGAIDERRRECQVCGTGRYGPPSE